MTSGICKLILVPRKIVEGNIRLWLPSGGSINDDTGFLVPSTSLTLTIPSTAQKPATVGAYDGETGNFAYFSGRGYQYGTYVKPDLVAPGVGIVSCAPGGGYTVRTGTSMACPFCHGKCRSADAVWHCKQTRFLPVRSEGKGISDPGSEVII